MGAIQFQRSHDLLQHCVRFPEHFVIPEPQHAKSSRCDVAVANLVMALPFLMLSAVKLDHELRLQTREVGNITADRHLPPEAVASKLPKPQKTPKVPFDIGGLISQNARPALRSGITHTTDIASLCPLPNPPPRRKGGREKDSSPHSRRKGGSEKDLSPHSHGGGGSGKNKSPPLHLGGGMGWGREH